MFTDMDDDDSGLISYTELADMVRNELCMDHEEVPERRLRRVWLALDADGTGHIAAGEFGVFMKKGADASERMTMEETP